MSCLRTFAGLCIHSKRIFPGTISERLDIEPTRSNELDVLSRYRHRREQHFWCWSTEGLIDSTSHIDHLSAIFVQLAGKEHVLDELRNEGCETTSAVTGIPMVREGRGLI